MSKHHRAFSSQQEHQPGDEALVLPLEQLDRTSFPLAGGKAANPGELIRAGFPVPAGFCVTTAAYAQVAAHVGLDPVLAALEAVSPADSARQIELATAMRTALSQTPLPPEVVETISTAYRPSLLEHSSRLPFVPPPPPKICQTPPLQGNKKRCSM